jgi:hypothetical protein
MFSLGSHMIDSRFFVVGDNMGLSNKKEDQLRSMPIIRSSIAKSKNGKYVVQRTTITNIKPVAYYEAVLSGKPEDDDIEEELKEFA